MSTLSNVKKKKKMITKFKRSYLRGKALLTTEIMMGSFLKKNQQSFLVGGGLFLFFNLGDILKQTFVVIQGLANCLAT